MLSFHVYIKSLYVLNKKILSGEVAREIIEGLGLLESFRVQK
jgi:hypothetical protein